MKQYVDQVSVTTTATRQEIWDVVKAKFYVNPDRNLSFSGLRREEALRRVIRAYTEEFGGSVYGQIEA
ncbi:hypothetical protein JG688_00012153 [Phytophthora aleatoria]|uniref:Uncharacterized protein n=1 Tax=Phytophthora aleatoria TaxID=2496075 RepID=A0A8J5J3B2_9STRA|nr:hypothetical protein JG688_00012153 [Phytophthora aleatoria]